MVLITIICVVAFLGVILSIVSAVDKAQEKKLKKAAEDSEEAKAQQLKWAEELHQQAHNVYNTCASNLEQAGNVIRPEYYAAAQMETILKEFAEISEVKGGIDSMAEDVRKGGVES